jgi:hypothetical protein
LNYLLPHGPSTGKEKNGRSSSSSTRSRRRRVLREVCKRKRKRGKATRYSRSVGYVIGLGFFFMKQEGFYPLLEFIKVKSKVYSNNTSRDKKKPRSGRGCDIIDAMEWSDDWRRRWVQSTTYLSLWWCLSSNPHSAAGRLLCRAYASAVPIGPPPDHHALPFSRGDACARSRSALEPCECPGVPIPNPFFSWPGPGTVTRRPVGTHDPEFLTMIHRKFGTSLAET